LRLFRKLEIKNASKRCGIRKDNAVKQQMGLQRRGDDVSKDVVITSRANPELNIAALQCVDDSTDFKTLTITFLDLSQYMLLLKS
jgi:hypothetical protein